MNPLASPDAWNLVAGGYAAEIEHVMRPIARAVVALVDARAPGIVDRARILDVACGPGTLALELASRAAQVQALDFSPAMLEQLRAEMRRRAVTSIVPVHGDGMSLPYGDERFAAAFSVFGLMFFPDRSKGFAELHRVLQPGGVAVVTSWAPIDLSPLMTLSFAALRAADPNMPPPQRNLLNLENPDRFAEELTAAGFTDVSVEAHEHLVPLASADEMWAMMSRSAAPLALMRRALGEEEWASRSQRAQAYLREAFAGGARTLGTTAYFGFGRKG